MTTQWDTSLSALVGRFFWMGMGPIALMLFAAGNITRGTGWTTPLDIGLLLTVLIIIFARRLEYSGGDPRTATGEPATLSHLRNFTWGTLIVGVAIWVAANVIGNSVLTTSR